MMDERAFPAGRLPPGQFSTEELPVVAAGPTPDVALDSWTFTLENEVGDAHAWTWAELMALPQERPRVDIHCVNRWSMFDTEWTGVSLDTLLEAVDTSAAFALAHCYGGYTTNLPQGELVGGRAWVVYALAGEPLHPEHGGPARLLVPHLYLWKSAKWIKGIRFLDHDEPGFWETAGYHARGDPWREERYAWG